MKVEVVFNYYAKEKRALFDYLDEMAKEMNRTSEGIIYVPNPNDIISGAISLLGDKGLPEEVVRYILSTKRTHSPTHVSCFKSGNYDLVEKILKEERGRNSSISSGIAGLLLNSRKIKY